MAFIIDKQTLSDLCVFETGRKKSIYDLFCRTTTRGGATLLQAMFRAPLSDAHQIRQRIDTIQFFDRHDAAFPFDNTLLDTVEYYLSNTDSRSQLNIQDNTLAHKFQRAIGANGEFDQIHKGVLAVIRLINTSRDLLEQYPWAEIATSFGKQIEALEHILANEELAFCTPERHRHKLAFARLADYDTALRFRLNDALHRLLAILYEIDVYATVAKVGRQHGFAYASPTEEESLILDVKGLFHPFLKNPVANDLHIDRSNNMIFLTGANMAGKSTFMKAISVAMYLAHVGFPVPAQSMKFATRSGMFTTINLPDNLNMGYSHFYAEVLRVKKVAQSVGDYPNLMVVFDELFRGTNVKDAYDATIAIAQAFAQKRNTLFIISTHIVEVAEELQKSCPNVNFIYLPTTLSGTRPQYTYRLAQGVTADRHGMMIIRNEHILDLLHDSSYRKAQKN